MVPVPGATAGSRKSRSKLTCSETPLRLPAGDPLGEQRRDAALVDRAHVDGVDAVRAEPRLLLGIDRAGAEERDVGGRDGVERPVAEERREDRVAGGEGQRHAVHVARGRGLGGVVVGVGVEPEHGGLAALAGAGAGDAGDRAHRDRMVAAEEHRHAGLGGHREGAVVDGAGPAGDLGQMVAAAGVAGRHGDRLGRDLVDRAAVGDPVAEVGEGADETRRCAAPAAPSPRRARRRRARGRSRAARCRGCGWWSSGRSRTRRASGTPYGPEFAPEV